jgi:hypothetical protein
MKSGGIIELVNRLGGSILSLIIGSKSAFIKTQAARWARIVTGSILIGFLLTLLMIGIDPYMDEAWPVPIVMTLIVCILLEFLRLFVNRTD